MRELASMARGCQDAGSRNLVLNFVYNWHTVLLYVGLDGVDEALDAALDDDVDDAAAEALVAPREFQRVGVVRAASELLLLSRILRNIDG